MVHVSQSMIGPPIARQIDLLNVLIKKYWLVHTLQCVTNMIGTPLDSQIDLFNVLIKKYWLVYMLQCVTNMIVTNPWRSAGYEVTIGRRDRNVLGVTGVQQKWMLSYCGPNVGKFGTLSKPEIIKDYTPIYSCNAFWIAFFTHLYLLGVSNKIPTTLNLTWHYQCIYDTRTFSATITPESAYLYSNIFSSVVFVIH